MGRWQVGCVLGGSVRESVHTGWVGGKEGLYWVGWWEIGSAMDGLVGGSVLDVLVRGSVLDGLVGGYVLDGLVGGSVLGGSVGGSVLDGLISM